MEAAESGCKSFGCCRARTFLNSRTRVVSFVEPESCKGVEYFLNPFFHAQSTSFALELLLAESASGCLLSQSLKLSV